MLNTLISFFMEFLSVRAGLDFPWKQGYRRIICECESDCAEVVVFIQSSHRLNSHALDRLMGESDILLKRDWIVQVVHVLCLVNCHKDTLARMGANSSK